MSQLRRALRLPTERRSYENPAVPLSGAGLSKLLGWGYGGWETDAGPVVSEQTALQYGAVLACTRVLAEGVGTLPLAMYERMPNGGRREVDEHPAQYLLQNQPNPEMTPSVFKETLQAHLCTWGNGYARIEWDGAGRPVALWPLLPHATRAERLLGSFELVYKTTWQNKRVTLDPAEVLHVPGLSFDGITGYSPIALLRQAVGIGLAAEQFTSAFYGNGAWLGGFFEHPEALGDDAHKHLQDSIEGSKGAPKAFKTRVLEEGMKWHQVQLPREDALFLGLRKMQRREIAAAYRVPPHMIADLEGGASFSSIEQMSLDFAMYSLAAWLKKWEQEVTRKLGIAPRFFAEFNMDGLLRADGTSRADYYERMIRARVMNPNEARVRENLAPYKAGDTFSAELNTGGAGEAEPTVEGAPAPKPEGFDEGTGGQGGGGTGTGTGSGGQSPAAERNRRLVIAHLGLIRNAMKRQMGRESDRAARELKRNGPEGLAAWLRTFHASSRDGYVADLLAPYEALVLALPHRDPAEEPLASIVSDRELCEAHVRAVVDQDHTQAVGDLMGAVELGRVEQLLRAWPTTRTESVADALLRATLGAIGLPTG